MTDAGDFPRPGKDVVVKSSSSVSTPPDNSRASVEHLKPEQRFIAQIKRWLHPNSPNTVSVRLPDKIDKRMLEPEVVPGRTQRFTFVDSPDGQIKIGLFAENPANSEEDPFRLIDVKWLDKKNRKTGSIRFMHYGDGSDDYFGQDVMTSPAVLSEEDIRRWEQEGTRTVGASSPSQHDMRPDLATALEGGTYNDTLTQNTLRYLQEKKHATRITTQDALPGDTDTQILTGTPTKEIEQ